MMHNWLELHLLAQERVSATLRGASALRPRPPAPSSHPPRCAPAAGATFVLRKGEVLSLRLSRRPFRVSCLAGRLWATVDGSPADHLLGPGEAGTFRGRGTVVLQALRTATARVDCETEVPVVLSVPLRPAVQAG